MPIAVSCMTVDDFPYGGPEVRLEISPSIEVLLENLELVVGRDYYSSFRKRRREPIRVSAQEYLYGNPTRWPDSSLLCPEMPLPRKLAHSVSLIAYPGVSRGEESVAVVHAGRAGCMAPVHYDWDHCWVAHACLTGRKRIFLLPPRAGWLLSPIINTSALCLPRFAEADRMEILQKLDGIDVVLEAGEGILFPSTWWHGVLYEDSSLSISVRFEQHAGGRPFAALPRSWFLQRLVERFFCQGYGPEASEFFEFYLQTFFDESDSGWRGRFRRVSALCRQTLLNMGERQGAEELVAEKFSAELALAVRELEFWFNDIGGNSTQMDRLQEVSNYLFEGIAKPPAGLCIRLAAYALSKRQGLPPQRGLIKVVQELKQE